MSTLLDHMAILPIPNNCPCESCLAHWEAQQKMKDQKLRLEAAVEEVKIEAAKVETKNE